MRISSAIYLLAVTVISISSIACEDPGEEEYVSPIMSAKVNGVRWNAAGIHSPIPTSIFYASVKALSVSATNYRNGYNAETISIWVSPCFADSTYLLGVGNQNPGRFFVRGTYQEYLTDATHLGQLTVASLDTLANVASGTFAFTAIDSASKSVVVVTEGTFRVNFAVW